MKTKKMYYSYALTALLLFACCSQNYAYSNRGEGVAEWFFGFFGLFGLFIIIGFICAFFMFCDAIGRMAERCGYKYRSWFCFALLISPLAAIIILYARGKTDAQERWDIEQDEIIRIKTRKKYESRGETPLST